MRCLRIQSPLIGIILRNSRENCVLLVVQPVEGTTLFKLIRKQTTFNIKEIIFVVSCIWQNLNSKTEIKEYGKISIEYTYFDRCFSCSLKAKFLNALLVCNHVEDYFSLFWTHQHNNNIWDVNRIFLKEWLIFKIIKIITEKLNRTRDFRSNLSPFQAFLWEREQRSFQCLQRF